DAFLPVECSERGTGTVPVTLDLDDVDAALDLDASREQRVDQDRFYIHLTHERDVGEGGVRQVKMVETRVDLPAAEVQADLGGGVRPFEQAPGDTERTQHLERAWLHGERA